MRDSRKIKRMISGSALARRMDDVHFGAAWIVYGVAALLICIQSPASIPAVISMLMVMAFDSSSRYSYVESPGSHSVPLTSSSEEEEEEEEENGDGVDLCLKEVGAGDDEISG